MGASFTEIYNDHIQTLRALNTQLSSNMVDYNNALTQARNIPFTQNSDFEVQADNLTVFVGSCEGRLIKGLTCGSAKIKLNKSVDEVRKIQSLIDTENESFEKSLTALGYSSADAAQAAQNAINQASYTTNSAVSWKSKAPYIIGGIGILLVAGIIFYVIYKKKKI